MEKEKILLIGRTSDGSYLMVRRFEKLLKEDFDINIILSDQDGYKNRYEFQSKLWNILNTRIYDKVILFESGLINYILQFMFGEKQKELIVYRHDITHFSSVKPGFINKIYSKIGNWSERYFLKKADKIIHKGCKSELVHLPYFSKIKNKREYLFREFINKDEISSNPYHKLSDKDNEIHLVYVGEFFSFKSPIADTFSEFIPKITSQKMHLHIYTHQTKTLGKIYQEIEKKDPYFHYEGLCEHKELIHKITQYDYGLYCHIWDRDSLGDKSFYLKFSIGGKLFDYITAKIPSIVSEDATLLSDFVESNGVGFKISHDGINDLKNIIPLKNREEYVNNIERYISNLSKDEFVKFIKE